MGFTIQDIEETPNPNALKFVLDRQICNGTLSFLEPPDCTPTTATGVGEHQTTVVHDLFAIQGIASLMFRNDFLTVNKRADIDWSQIKVKIRKVLLKAEPLEPAGF